MTAMPHLHRPTRFRSKLLVPQVFSCQALLPSHPPKPTASKMRPWAGTAATDYLLYDSNNTHTFLNPNASLQTILGGTAANPTGNVELAASSEKAGFDFTKTRP